MAADTYLRLASYVPLEPKHKCETTVHCTTHSVTKAVDQKHNSSRYTMATHIYIYIYIYI